MEPGQRIGQAGGRQIADQKVKYSQGITNFASVATTLNSVERLGRRDKAQGPPEGALRIDPVIQAILSGDYPGQLPRPDLKLGMIEQTPVERGR